MVGTGLSLLQMFSSDNSSDSPPPEPAPDPAAAAAAAAAARQQAANAEAADVMQAASTDMASLKNQQTSAPTGPSASAAINSLLGSDQSSPNSAAAINSLPTPNGGTEGSTATISNLLTPDNSDPSGSGNAPADNNGVNEVDFPQQSGPVSGPGVNEVDFPQQPSVNQAPPSDVTPPDAAMGAAYHQSTDQPDPSQTASLPQMLQGSTPPSGVSDDVLDATTTPGGWLASSATNDPVVRESTSDQGSLATMPLPTAGDDADTATNKVFGQSVVGFGDLLKGLAGGPVAWPKGLYKYGTKMVNQMGEDLGLANAQILSPEATSSAGSP